MAIVESDLELLEESLDGGLDAGASAALNVRLASDKDLAAQLVMLKSQRAIRQAALTSMEPDAASAERLIWRVRGAMHDQKSKPAQPVRVWNSWNFASFGSAAAACLMVGFLFGRVGHSGIATTQEHNPGIASNGGGSSLVDVKNDASSSPSQFVSMGHLPQISVPVTNEYGQVVAWQNFDNPEQAKSFTEDLHRSRSAVPTNSGQVKVVDHEQEVPF